MFLHVDDTLIDLLIGSLQTLDRVNQSLRVHSLTSLTHHKHHQGTRCEWVLLLVRQEI